LPGNFVIAALLTRNFGLNEGWFGLIASLPAWCNVVQILLMPALARHFNPKTTTIAMAWLHLACWTALAFVLPFLPVDNPGKTALFFVVFFLFSSLLASMTGVSWTSWIQEWIPERVRGRYFGYRNRLITFGSVLFLLGVGKLLGLLDNALIGYQIVILFGAVLRCVSIVGQHFILSDDGMGKPKERVAWSQYPAILTSSPGLGLFVAFGAVFGFATGVVGPFYNVFMYELLELSVSKVSFLVILSSVGGALSFPAWGGMLHKHGNKPVLIFCLVAWQVQNYLWCVLTPGTAWILYFMWAWGGIFAAGYFMASFNLLLKLVPAKTKTTGISIYVAITSLAAAVAPVIGGQIYRIAFSNDLDPWLTYRATFLLQPTLCLLGCLILVRIHEPRSASVRTVIGAMRSMRQIGTLLGLSFLVNYTFLRPRRGGKGGGGDRTGPR
jgi:MFS family permease